jgi:hypothetical protein
MHLCLLHRNGASAIQKQKFDSGVTGATIAILSLAATGLN